MAKTHRHNTALVYVFVSAVMCGNIAQRVNSLCFIQRSIKSYSISFLLVCIQSLSDTNRLWQTLTDFLSLSLTNRLRTPVYIYMWLNLLERQHVSTDAHSQTQYGKERALTSYSRAPSLINSQRLLGRHTEVSRQPRGTPTFHIRHPGFHERATRPSPKYRGLLGMR